MLNIGHFKVNGYTFMFEHHFTKGSNFVTSCLLPWRRNPSKLGFTLKGKNLLLEEQILSFKSESQLRREGKMKLAELLFLNVKPFTLIMLKIRSVIFFEVYCCYLNISFYRINLIYRQISLLYFYIPAA